MLIFVKELKRAKSPNNMLDETNKQSNNISQLASQLANQGLRVGPPDPANHKSAGSLIQFVFYIKIMKTKIIDLIILQLFLKF